MKNIYSTRIDKTFVSLPPSLVQSKGTKNGIDGMDGIDGIDRIDGIDGIDEIDRVEWALTLPSMMADRVR